MARMNMLQLNFEKGWRGGERQTLYNMIGFRNVGYQVALLCRKGCPLESKAKAEGFDTFGFSDILGVIFFLTFQCRKYYVFHVQTSHILTHALLTKIFHGAKIIFTRRIDNIPKGRLTRLKYHLTDKVIVISNAIKEVVETFINEKVVVISDIGVERKMDETHAKKLIENLKINEDTFIIATTAALTKDKAPTVMLEAIRILASRKKNFVFLHFGSGPLKAQMEKLIKSYELENVYYMMGFIENVEDIFSMLDVFAMSSEMEGLGSSVLDAFIYKVPVVSTDAGGLLELVKDGRGIVCKKNSPELLAAGIERVLTDMELRLEMITNAFIYVKEFHSMERITNQYIEQLNSLSTKSKS